MTPEQRPLRMTHLWRRRNGHVVLFSDATFNVRRFDLNAVGFFVWELSDGKRTAAEIVERVSAAYPDESKTSVRTSVLAFLAELEREWIVRAAEAVTPDD